MSTLNSVAFYDRLMQQVQDNLGYRTANSLPMARLLLEAIEGLLIVRPSEVRGGGASGESTRFDLATLHQMKRDVEKWITGRNIASSQYTYLEYCPE